MRLNRKRVSNDIINNFTLSSLKVEYLKENRNGDYTILSFWTDTSSGKDAAYHAVKVL